MWAPRPVAVEGGAQSPAQPVPLDPAAHSCYPPVRCDSCLEGVSPYAPTQRDGREWPHVGCRVSGGPFLCPMQEVSPAGTSFFFHGEAPRRVDRPWGWGDAGDLHGNLVPLALCSHLPSLPLPPALPASLRTPCSLVTELQ